MSHTERKLLKQIKAGDEDAFKKLFSYTRFLSYALAKLKIFMYVCITIVSYELIHN